MQKHLHKRVGLIMIAVAVVTILIILWSALGVGFYLKPPHEKLLTRWKADLAQLEKAQKLPSQWNDIREIQLRSDNSPIQEWLPQIKAPIQTNPNGRYRLEIFLIHWIEKYKYGVVVEYNLIDLTSNNKVWEFGRTYPLGFIY